MHSYWTIETQGKTNNKLITMARVLFINNTAYACIWPVHFFAIKWITQWPNDENIYIIDANFMNLCFYIAYKSNMQLHTYKVASKWEKHFVHHIHVVTAFSLQLLPMLKEFWFIVWQMVSNYVYGQNWLLFKSKRSADYAYIWMTWLVHQRCN